MSPSTIHADRCCVAAPTRRLTSPCPRTRTSASMVLQQRVADRTPVELDHIVRMASAKPETVAVTGSEAQRGAVGPRRDGGADVNDGFAQFAGSLQGLEHDGCFEAELRGGVDVLPGAAAAARSVPGARWLHSIGRGLDDIDHFGANEVLLGLHHLDGDQLVRQGTANEGDATIGEAGNGVAASRHLFSPHHDRRHRRRL